MNNDTLEHESDDENKKAINSFKPFENDSQAMLVGPGEGLNIENGKDSIVIFGDISFDKNDENAKKSLEDVIETLTKIKNSF